MSVKESPIVCDTCQRVGLPGYRVWSAAYNAWAPYTFSRRPSGLEPSDPLDICVDCVAAGVSLKTRPPVYPNDAPETKPADGRVLRIVRGWLGGYGGPAKGDGVTLDEAKAALAAAGPPFQPEPPQPDRANPREIAL